MFGLAYYHYLLSTQALCLGLGICTTTKTSRHIRTSTSLASSSTGPPLPLRNLSRNEADNIQLNRPYYHPNFVDLSTPQQHSYTVKRVARNSDVFHIKGFLTEWECQAIMDEAKYNYHDDENDDGTSTTSSSSGMAKAVSNDGNQQHRTNCRVAWLGDSRIGSICGMIGNSVEDSFLTNEAKTSINSKRSNLQVLNYQEGGGFVLHHDGHDRILTVIMFLNGVGETWLPLVDVDGQNNGIVPKFSCQQHLELESLDEATQRVTDNGLRPGSSGILLSGNVCDSTTHGNGGNINRITQLYNNRHVVPMDPGDAVAFYNYGDDGKADFQSIHAGVPLDYKGQDGKWIATSWFHAPSLINEY